MAIDVWHNSWQKKEKVTLMKRYKMMVRFPSETRLKDGCGSILKSPPGTPTRTPYTATTLPSFFSAVPHRDGPGDRRRDRQS